MNAWLEITAASAAIPRQWGWWDCGYETTVGDVESALLALGILAVAFVCLGAFGHRDRTPRLRTWTVVVRRRRRKASGLPEWWV